ncbi:RagB/SusD family nutrient uptake outer membrane protein, partial [bacterium]|nr:RagB/SusD family nutrient uptake outer membrane protein [bacterium]
PYIYPFLSSLEDVVQYVEEGTTYVDSVKINFDAFGLLNDTLYNQTVELDPIFLDMETVVDSFTFILEEEVKIVGGYAERDDSWAVSCWDEFSRKALLSQMYLFRGDLMRANDALQVFLYQYDPSYVRFGLDNQFSFEQWKSIFYGINGYEHIYTIWFDKDLRQKNGLQEIFGIEGSNKYMVRPTSYVVSLWESIFDDMKMVYKSAEPQNTKLAYPGTPGDFYRGYGVSYAYYQEGIPMEVEDVQNMLLLKQEERFGEANSMMTGVDTVLYKYSFNRDPFDRDAYIHIYRASGMHLYAAEVLALLTDIGTGRSILNDGLYANNYKNLGVRGRVGLGELSSTSGWNAPDDGVLVAQYVYFHDPNTNVVLGYRELPTLYDKQLYLVEKILEERARELAFEGERFYDLVRIAKRRNDPAFLADRVSAKFEQSRRDQMRALLMDESNWYIDYFSE